MPVPMAKAAHRVELRPHPTSARARLHSENAFLERALACGL